MIYWIDIDRCNMYQTNEMQIIAMRTEDGNGGADLAKIIWLIDATSYKKDIDYELLNIKKDYFKIKSYVRQRL